MKEVEHFALERSARRKRGADRDVQNGTSRENRSLQRRNSPRVTSAAGFAGWQGSGAKCVGIDEVGRGSWAGPLLVVAARQIGDLPADLTDSKLMTKNQREKMLNMLSIACEFGEGWVKPSEIDGIGLAGALRLGISRALKNLGVQIEDEIILDGEVNYIPKKFKRGVTLIDADNLVPVVSAAGVYAKVRRDNFMAQIAQKYPNYSFEKHVGYGTSEHRQAIERHGILTEIHRLSFKPIKALARAAA